MSYEQEEEVAEEKSAVVQLGYALAFSALGWIAAFMISTTQEFSLTLLWGALGIWSMIAALVSLINAMQAVEDL